MLIVQSYRLFLFFYTN